jgi:hypothetical protein
MNRREFVKRSALWVPAATGLLLPRKSRAASLSYFGYNENGTDTGNTALGYGYGSASPCVMTCPGSGKQAVKELGVRLEASSGTVTFRISIYTTGNAFVTQGSAAIVTSQYPAGWVSHTSFVDQAGSPATPELDGGTDYRIVYSGTKTGTSSVMRANSGTLYYLNAGDYSGGYPSSLPTADGTLGWTYCLRCGVEPAAATTRRRVVIAQ